MYPINTNFNFEYRPPSIEKKNHDIKKPIAAHEAIVERAKQVCVAYIKFMFLITGERIKME